MKLKCPRCGAEDSLGMYVNLRRFYGPSSLSWNAGEPESIMYEGYGSQVDDELDYLTCESCDSESTVDEVVAAQAVTSNG